MKNENHNIFNTNADLLYIVIILHEYFADIDDYSMGTCDDNAKCINTHGSFYCECMEGNLIDLNPKNLWFGILNEKCRT